MKAKPQDLIVYIAAAVLVVTAAAYHLRKWNNTTLDISQSELNGLCQSVTGCKSAKLGWAADRKQSTISLDQAQKVYNFIFNNKNLPEDPVS